MPKADSYQTAHNGAVDLNKQYWWFSYHTYEANGGINDLVGTYSTRDELSDAYDNKEDMENMTSSLTCLTIAK